MGKRPYWNDPAIAEQRDRELEQVLPVRRRPRKPRKEPAGKGAAPQSSEPDRPTRQSADQSPPH
jgi:hypothetical protein